ncbi:SGNH/GDSL hydrolase family protein [Sutcliffiella horikoshii]|uniref:SGNH/GDSL hydrolase family protein n=1 Tax=Sutcliffiella horikoshii TaxID=79883 RepID=UPI00385037DA
MKKIAIIFLCTVAVSLIYLGKMQYDKKIMQAETATVQVQTSNSTESSLLSLSKNMSGSLQTKVKSKIESKETIKLLIVGSGAIMNGDAINLPWPITVKNALEANYGQGIFNVDVMNFENFTTHHLIELKGHEQIAAKKPDILIIEPLLLNDNGFVIMEDTLKNLDTIIVTVRKINSEAHIILQPPNPIYEPVTYLEQVKGLEEYASQKNIEYFNHWEDWPETSSENIKEVLQGTFPNAKGQNIWANYIVDYLVSK